jgi:type III secretion protein U
VSDKTEQPTPKRLRKAQEEGDTPLSSFATQSAAFVAAVAVAPSAIVALSTQASADLRSAIGVAAKPSPTIAFDGAALASSVAVLVAPILAAAAVTAALASVVQTGGAIATKRLVPRLDKLDPISGLRQLFSSTRLLAVLRAAVFGAAVALIVYGTLREHAADLARSAGRVESAAKLAGILALDVAKRVAVVGLFLAVLDVVVTRRAWTKKLMMTKEEVKREHKESEGDPQLKAARERAHHEMLASATIANVKTATVVIVNPTHLACALRYDEKKDDGEEGDDAPVVVATGQGDLARKIVEAAHQYGVPVVRDVPLARALVALEVGDEIPEVLYEAVAEILRDAWEEADRTASKE